MKSVLVRLAELRETLLNPKQTEASLQQAYNIAFAIGMELASDRRATETESDLSSDILDQISGGLVQLRQGNQPILALARADTNALKSAIEKRASDRPKGVKEKLRMAQPLHLELPLNLPAAKPKRIRS
jgi:hypothetical protein